MNSTPKNREEVATERGGRYAFINFSRLNDARDDVREGLSEMTRYADAFRAFADMFKRDCDVEIALSPSGADGLSFICEMLSEKMYSTVIDLPNRLDDMRGAISFDHASRARDAEEAGND